MKLAKIFALLLCFALLAGVFSACQETFEPLDDSSDSLEKDDIIDENPVITTDELYIENDDPDVLPDEPDELVEEDDEPVVPPNEPIYVSECLVCEIGYCNEPAHSDLEVATNTVKDFLFDLDAVFKEGIETHSWNWAYYSGLTESDAVKLKDLLGKGTWFVAQIDNKSILDIINNNITYRISYEDSLLYVQIMLRGCYIGGAMEMCFGTGDCKYCREGMCENCGAPYAGERCKSCYPFHPYITEAINSVHEFFSDLNKKIEDNSVSYDYYAVDNYDLSMYEFEVFVKWLESTTGNDVFHWSSETAGEIIWGEATVGFALIDTWESNFLHVYFMHLD